MSGVACSRLCMTHEACWQLVLSTSTGTSLGITDASAFFIVLMIRDSRRGKPSLRSNDRMAGRIYLLLAIFDDCLCICACTRLAEVKCDAERETAFGRRPGGLRLGGWVRPGY